MSHTNLQFPLYHVDDDKYFWLYYSLPRHGCLCAICHVSRAVVLCLVICECECIPEPQPVWVRTRPARGRIVGSAAGFWKTKHCHLLMLLAAVSVVTHQKHTRTQTATRAHTLANIIKVVDISVALKPLTKYPSALSHSDRLTSWDSE